MILHTYIYSEIVRAVRGAGVTLGAGFFAVCICLFPLGFGGSPAALAAAAPAIILIVALLAVLLTLDLFYREDDVDGTFDILLSLPRSAEWIMAGKMTAQFCVGVLPLSLAAGLAGIMLGLPAAAAGMAVLAVAVAGIGLCAVGGFSAVLACRARGGGAVTAVIALPLMIPAVIFASAAIRAAVDAAQTNVPAGNAAILLLCAYATAAVTVALPGAAAVLTRMRG